MSQAARKFVRVNIPDREPNKTAYASPVKGSHAKKVSFAFAVVFSQYEKAFEELSKV